MRKRSLALLLSPVIMLLWLVGWITFCVGSKKAERQPCNTRKHNKRETLEIISIVDEETFVTIDSQ